VYAVVGWLLIQVTDVVLPMFEAPQWAAQTITFAIILGFPLALILAWAFDLTRGRIIRTKNLADSDTSSGQPVAAVAQEKKSQSDTLPSSRAVLPIENLTPEARGKRIQSLVVLPLTNLSSDPEQEYFADGMTEILIANLAKVRALRIVSRTSAMRYKGSNSSLPEIAEELNIDAVVEGSVLRAGQRVRITIQLIRAATDEHLWAESYERDVQDVLLLQSEVAQAVTREIQVAVTPEENRILASARRVNPEAYDAYLKGRFHFWKASPEDLDKALEYYNLALEKDPDYAMAYAHIGDVWGARGSFGFVLPHEALSIGKPAALKAVELDDGLAEGHEMLARFKLFYEWDWATAESESHQAIALNPNSPDVGFAYWWLLLVTKRFAAAMKQAEHALDLDPFNSTFQWILGWQLLFEGRYDNSIAQFNKVRATQPNFPMAHWGLWSSFHRNGMTEQALVEAKQYFVLIGNREGAEAMEQEDAESSYQTAMLQGAENLVAQTKLRYVQPTLIARLYAHAEEKDLALDWLEKAYEVREPWSVLLNVDVDWDSLRDEPRFAKLLKEIGLER
jgi:TolB-like protein